jgi:hypothetical protein
MAELKTKPTGASVADFIASVADDQRRKDSETMVALMQEVTGQPPEMWGDSIVGFGRYHYRYESGRTGEWMVTAFSPRKESLTLYIMSGFDELAGLMARLGKHKTGKGCLYIKRLSDVDMGVLREMLERSVAKLT